MRTVLLILLSIGGNLAQNFNSLFVCPDNWIPNGERCYQFSFEPRNYDDAAHMCQKNGAILLSIDDNVENSFVVSHLRKVDNLRQEWYTSGERDSSSVVARYVWTATHQEISLVSNIWIDRLEPINEDITRDILVLKYDAKKGIYGVAAVSGRYEQRNYICEISRNEVYRININKRGYDYGTSFKNLNDVHRGPKFIVEAASTVVISDKAEGMVYMECIASGIPQPEYKWITNNSGVINEIKSDLDGRYTITNGKFTIENPSESNDAGVYQCIVENSVGAIISAPAQLSFASLGEFPNIQAAPVNPLEFQGAVIECPNIPSRFSQAVVYQWKKSEEDVYTGDPDKLRKSDVRPDLNKHVFVSGNGKLYFSEVTSADNYYYYCIATLTTLNLNQNFISTSWSPSRTAKPVRLDVRVSSGGTYEPRIQDSFINVVPGSPVVGMNISLECFAYGTMPLLYEWEVPRGVRGRYQLTDSNRVLRINNVQQDDSGDYSCRVASSKATGQQSDKKSYTLYVESKPDFIVPLTDQHLDRGTRQLTWRCEARGVPFPTYTWYKNAQVMQNSSDGDRLVIGNTLFLRNLQHERDSGMYQCIAQNSHGVSSSSAQLRILEVMPTFAKFPMPSTMAGAVGGNITIPCRPEAAPFPEITWLRNGGNLNPGTDSGSRLQLTIEGDLKIRDLNMGDQGSYECRAVNELGEDRNKTFLTIMQSTSIYQPPTNQRVEVNKTAFLYCQASFSQNKLDLIYQWAFNGRVIDIQRNEHFRRGTGDQQGGLYLIFAQYDHSGIYTCIAQTQVDSARASAQLLVTGPPGEPAGVEAYSASEKISQELSDSLSVGDTDVVLRWTDPLDDHGAPIQTYMIYGQTNYSDAWSPLYTYIPQPSTVVIGSVDSQRRQFLLRNLSPGVGYAFKVKAVNMFGVGMESKPTKRTTIPGSKPTKPPRNVGGGGGSVGTLRMTWDALPPVDHNGWGIGYIVEYRKRPPAGEEATSNIKWNKIEVFGNKSEASALVGKDNYYLLYQVKVTPFNDFGEGPMVQNNSVYSAEDIPIGIPSNLYAEPFNESAIIVHWDPVPLDRTYMKGELKGFKIDYWLMSANSSRNSQASQEYRENRDDALQTVLYGNVDHGMIIGLQPDTWYTVSVIVFNDAGNGLKSEVVHQSTEKAAPRNYPVHIKVFPSKDNSVLIRFRGVSTTVDEEPLLGYKIRYWRDTEDIRNASDVTLGKVTEGTVYKIQEGYLYHLRVLGYSVGGDGKMSSPETLFTYSRGRVVQVSVDPTTTNVTYVTYSMKDSGETVTSCYILMVISLMTSLLMLISL